MAIHVEPASRGAVLDPAPPASAESSSPGNAVQAPADHVHVNRSLSARQRTASPTTSPSRRHVVALAGLQILLGYQLLVSGVDKLLYATFPDSLGQLLAGTLRGAIPGPFAALLRAVVLPHSAVFGYLVEWGETLAGLGLIAGALVALDAPELLRRTVPTLAPWITLAERMIARLALAAAVGAAVMGFSFYLLDGAPSQWFTPSVAFGGALDPGMLLVLGSLALLADAAAEWLRHRSRAHRRLWLAHPAMPALPRIHKSA